MPRGQLRRIARPRLLRRLVQRFRIAVISAPAGYGKTTLAAQFVERRRAIWHRVGPEDRETAHLLASLLDSAARLDGRAMTRRGAGKATLRSGTAELFASRRDFERDGLLLAERFADEISGRSGETWIVLDDLHLLEGASETLAWLRRWMERCASRVRFLFTCRGESPLALSRFELEGGVLRLSARDLAFDDEEESRFLRANPPREEAGAGASAGFRRALNGWPAGLALLASGRQASSAGSLPRGSDEARVYAFLAEEVLAALSPSADWALCRAALPETLEPTLLRALLGPNGARELARVLAQRDLFVEQTERGGRFHPLFRTCLLRRFEQDPRASAVRARIPGLARRMERQGLAHPAIRLLADTGHPDAAAEHFARAAQQAPGAWLPALGPLATELVPRLRAPSAWIEYHAGNEELARRRYDSAAAHFRRAQRLFVARREWRSAALAYRQEALVAFHTGEHGPALAAARALLAEIPARQTAARGLLLLHSGDLSLQAGKPAEARRVLTEAERVLRRAGLELAASEAALRRAKADFTAGKWHLFTAQAQRTLAVYRSAGYVGRTTPLLVNLAAANVYLGQEEQAIAELDEVRRLLERDPIPGLRAVAEVIRFRALAEAGRTAEAAAQLVVAEREVREHGSPVAGLELSVWRGVFERRRGRWARAERVLAGALDRARRIDSPWWRALSQMEWALVVGLRGRPEEGLRALREAARLTVRLGDRKELARNALYEARLRLASGAPFTQAFARALREIRKEDHHVLLEKEASVARPLLEASARRETPQPLRAAARAISRPAGPGRMQSAIELRLLGGFEILRGGASVHLERRSSERLIAFLALRRGQPVSRESIAEALWPGAHARASRNRFDVALSIARRALEPEAGSGGPYRMIQSESGLLRLDTDLCRVDVDEFARRANAARGWVERVRGAQSLSPPQQAEARRAVEAALASYAGDLLPEAIDAEWLEPARLRLRDQRRTLLLTAAQLALTTHRAEDALESADAAITSDPLDEEAHRVLFRALASSRGRDAVLRRFRAFRRRLREELRTEPSPETVALVRALITGTAG